MAEDLPEVQFAEYPQRSCRIVQSPDGLVDHPCALPEVHPGPCCPRTEAGIKRRQTWEQAHPNWQAMARNPDPFADFTKIPGVTP